MPEKHVQYIGAAEANMLSWLVEIHELKDIPPFFKEVFNSFCKSNEIPYTVFCPGQKPGRHDKDSKLLCMDSERLMIASRDQRPFIAKLSDIRLISVTRVLLSSMFCIYSDSGYAYIDFNSVCKLLINRVINARRKIDNNAPEVKLPREILDLRETDYKGYAIALAELQGAREMKLWIRQQKIRGRFGFMPPRIAAQMLFVTEDELIWVTENPKEPSANRSYGGTSHYVFLKDIDYAKLKYKYNDTLILDVKIKGGKELAIKLPASRLNEAEEAMHYLDRYK